MGRWGCPAVSRGGKDSLRELSSGAGICRTNWPFLHRVSQATQTSGSKAPWNQQPRWGIWPVGPGTRNSWGLRKMAPLSFLRLARKHQDRRKASGWPVAPITPIPSLVGGRRTTEGQRVSQCSGGGQEPLCAPECSLPPPLPPHGQSQAT